MPLISVLTSIYNETFQEIRQAIQSIQKQTFKDWELILVNDNPHRPDLILWLKSFVKTDPRIRLLLNPENIGLARSMNRAADAACGTYLARMDADDISTPKRLEKELSLLLSEDCGLVCSRYKTIDEQGYILWQEGPCYTPKQMAALLPCRNIIHHPTVLMRKDLFLHAGGYRPYPCAQDYDLWLRFLKMGAKMVMHQEALLYYRIRLSSTTGQRRYLQALTLNYIRKTYRQNQILNLKPPFFDYESYLHQHGYHNPKARKRFEKATKLLKESQTLSHPQKFIRQLYAALICEVYRRNLLYQIQAKRLRK